MELVATDLVDNFVCECAAGFTGENCTVDINECDPNPFVNNATGCIDNISNYIYMCVYSWLRWKKLHVRYKHY